MTKDLLEYERIHHKITQNIDAIYAKYCINLSNNSQSSSKTDDAFTKLSSI